MSVQFNFKSVTECATHPISTPEVVFVRADSGWSYVLVGKAVAGSPTAVVVEVRHVLDYPTRTEIKGGDVLSIVGTQITVPISSVSLSYPIDA